MSSTKTVLITGAASGVGYALARELAKRNYRVYISARTQAKAEDAVNRLKEESDFPGAFIAAPALELDDIAKVRRFVVEFEPKLDGLVLNAGVISPKKVITGDGVELHFAAKVIGHHVLTVELNKKGSLRSGAVVIVVGSENSSGKLPGMSLPDYRKLSREKKGGDLEGTFVSVMKGEEGVTGKYKYMTANAVANYFMELWAYSLAPRFAQQGIKVFASSPGSVLATNVTRNMPWLLQKLMSIIGPILMGDQTPEDAVKHRFIPFFEFPEKFETGRFYASPVGAVVGPLTLYSMPHLIDQEASNAVVRAIERVSGTRFVSAELAG